MLSSMEQLRPPHAAHGHTFEPGPNLDPAELRALAAHLLSIANAINSATGDESTYLSLAAAERNQPASLASAEAEYNARCKRRSFFSKALLGEPAWDILLDLFIQKTRRKRVSVMSACHASGVPPTTALRWLSMLEREGMIERVPAVHDRRVQYLQLTGGAELALAQWLKHRAPS